MGSDGRPRRAFDSLGVVVLAALSGACSSGPGVEATAGDASATGAAVGGHGATGGSASTSTAGSAGATTGSGGNTGVGGGGASGATLTLTDTGSGLDRVVIVESSGLFRIAFEANDNWGLDQWYDLVNDPGARANLLGPAYGVSPDITVAEPAMFQQVFYGTSPDDPKLYTKAAYYYFPDSPRSFDVIESGTSKVVVTATSSPIATSQGVLSNVVVGVTYSIYPDGRIFVHSVMSVSSAQTATDWRCAVMGLADPADLQPTGGGVADTEGWMRASAGQNPYSYVPDSERYLFAYWTPQTPSPYADYTKASILLVPKPGNPSQGTQLLHDWVGFKRWGYGYNPIDLPAASSVVQDYLLQLGARGSAVLPDVTSSAVADPIADAYTANPTAP